MALISLFSRLVNGMERQVDLSTNTIVVQAIQINGVLLSSSASGNAGSKLVGDDNSYTNISPAAATVKGALQAIDTALGSAGAAANKTLSNLTSPTAINQDMLPDSSLARTFGSSSLVWSAAWIKELLYPSFMDIRLDQEKIYNHTGSTVIDVGDAQLNDNSSALSLDWTARLLKNSSAASLADWSGSVLKANAGLDFNSQKGINLANPTVPSDAANKSYVDNLAQGLNWKQTVHSATTGALPTYIYASNVITAAVNGALPAQDGVTMAANDRLLVKDESGANAPFNGIYVVTQVGDGSTPFILTRSSDANTAVSLQWATVEVSPDASAQAGYIFRESDDITTIGTDNVAFALVSKGLDWIFSNGLSVSGNTVTVLAADSSIGVSGAGVAVALNAASGLVTSSGLKINLATSNPGLQIASNQLDIKYGAAIVASSSGISLNVDNSSIEISSNAARIKSTAYDQVTITGGGGSPAAVQQAPAMARSLVAGQTFAANTSFAVRWGITANGETAGRVYAADIDTSSFDLFYVIGMASSAAGVTAGQNINVTSLGSFALSSSDTAFASSTDGLAVFLTASGTFSVIPPSTSGQAVTRIGIVQVRSATNTSCIIDVDPAAVGVN